MIEVLVQGAFVSDKVAVVNSSGWERMIVQSESSKKERCTEQPKGRRRACERQPGNSSIIGPESC